MIITTKKFMNAPLSKVFETAEKSKRKSCGLTKARSIAGVGKTRGTVRTPQRRVSIWEAREILNTALRSAE